MTPLRRRMLDELQRRNYTTDTIRGYIHAVKEFAEYFGKSPEALGAEEVREFQLYMIRDKKLALGTVALRMGALRFLYKKTLRRRDIDIDDLPLVRAPRKLPVVLGQEEVVRLIEAAPNLHYRTLLMLLYATGLRRAEAVRLKISDVDTSLMLIHVHQGKGSRDRELPLTPKLLEALREYWQSCKRKPRIYLFPSRFRAQPHLSTRQYARVVHAWVESAGLDSSAYGTHSMRRTKAAQIYRKTGNLRAVQLLLETTTNCPRTPDRGADLLFVPSPVRRDRTDSRAIRLSRRRARRYPAAGRVERLHSGVDDARGSGALQAVC